MSDPADKSDDLIAELAKLMATNPGGSKPAVEPLAKPAPLDPNGSAPVATPMPIRIPGMDAMAPKPQAPAPQPEAQRAPMTGSIRIPGMDQPAPVSTTAPVSKFDFGAKPVVSPIKAEPLSSLSQRLAAGNNLARDSAPAAEPAPQASRIPSDLRPVSENRSFGEGPALVVTKPAPTPSAPAPSFSSMSTAMPSIPTQAAPPASKPVASDFNFDFGFNQPAPTPPVVPPINGTVAHGSDLIAALIEADMASEEPELAEPEMDEPEAEAPTEEDAPARPQMATVTPIQRMPAAAQPAKITIAPISSAPPKPSSGAPIPLKPVSVAPRAPESDRFAISPGVGLNMRPPAGQPLNPQPRAPEPVQTRDESDPMSEIESLIGEAVRVELSPGPVRVQTPQQVSPHVELEPEDEVEAEIAHRPQQPPPVVPPLTTQFAPRRANLKDEVGTTSAEDAILAAAAASGAQVGRVEPTVGDDSPYRRLKVKPQRSSFLSGGMRQYIGMAVAGTLLLAAGLGLYWVLNMGRTNTTGANAPQLTADATPVKVKPAQTTKPATDAAKSPVLAKMDGASSAPSSEQLVSTDETSGPGAAPVTRDVTPATDTGEGGLANRKVRTVTVRPDGTIVPGDDAVAGGEELPVARPNVPSVPSTESVNLLGSDPQTAATDPTTTATPKTTTAAASPTLLTPATTDSTAADATTQVAAIQPTIDPTIVAPTPMAFPVRGGSDTALSFSDTSAKPTNTKPTTTTASTKPTNTSVNALVGAQTPNGQIDLLGGGTDPAPQQVAVSKPTPTTTASGSGGAAAYVQLSSQPTEADAQSSLKTMSAKYGSLFGGAKLVVQKADLGQKGIRYRIRLPASSLSQANGICAQIKAAGGDCFATNG